MQTLQNEFKCKQFRWEVNNKISQDMEKWKRKEDRCES